MRTPPNFQAYPYWFGPAMAEHGFVAVFPTWGLGLWPAARVETRIFDVLADVEREFPIDRGRVVLCGLSAGGRAAVKIAARGRLRLAGVAVISGSPRLTDPDAERLARTPLLIVHGANDTHMPVQPARKLAEQVAATHERSESGGVIDYVEFPGADHTLMFVKRQEIVRRVGEWAAALDARTAGE